MNDIKSLVREDREAVLARDPAATSMAEVRLCYPDWWRSRATGGRMRCI